MLKELIQDKKLFSKMIFAFIGFRFDNKGLQIQTYTG